MHALTDPRLFLWITQKNVYGNLKRNKIAVDVSHMSHSRTYTLYYPVRKKWISKRRKKTLKRLVEKLFFFYLSRPVQSWNILPHLYVINMFLVPLFA